MRRLFNAVKRVLMVFLACFILPLGLSVGSRYIGEAWSMNWWEARNDSSQQAPDPATTPEAVIEVYAARAFGWRGAFGVHTWIAGKRSGAAEYIRVEVIGWRLYRGLSVVSVHNGIGDGYWFGSRPFKLVSLRGDGIDEIIDEVEAAASRYPFTHRYRVWPGPNSNTFTAFIGREVPALGLDMPPHAVGKDYLTGAMPLARAPSGTGYQFSILGVAGLMVAAEEGLEVNLLGLTFGLDAWPPALKLPGIGRVGFAQVNESP